MEELEKIFKHSDSILFSTELVPNNKNIENWHYLTEQTGQHISFYSLKSLEILANKFDKKLYTNNKNIHLITSKKINRYTFKLFTDIKFSRIISLFFKNKGLLKDYDNLTQTIQNENKI